MVLVKILKFGSSAQQQPPPICRQEYHKNDGNHKNLQTYNGRRRRQQQQHEQHGDARFFLTISKHSAYGSLFFCMLSCQIISLFFFSGSTIYPYSILSTNYNKENIETNNDIKANNNNTNNNNKTLVILTGNLRCGEVAWETLYRNVLDGNSADLALMIGDTLPQYKNASVFQRAKFVWTFQEYNDWGIAIDEMEINERARIVAAASAASVSDNTTSITTSSSATATRRTTAANDINTLSSIPSWREAILPKAKRRSIVLGGVKGFSRGSGAIQFIVRYYIQEKIRRFNLTNQYHQFVITRSDAFYKSPLNLSTLDKRFIWVPKGMDWGGINDRQVIVNRDDVFKVLDGFPAMVRDPHNVPHEIVNANPEEFLLYSWKVAGIDDKKKIRRFNTPFYVCSIPGDQFAGFKPQGMGQDGLYYKMKREYDSARITWMNAKKSGIPLSQKPDPNVICPLRRQWLESMMLGWDKAPPKDSIPDTIRWFRQYLEDCTAVNDHHASTMTSFNSLFQTFQDLVGTGGMSDNPVLICRVVPQFAEIMVNHPYCINNSAGLPHHHYYDSASASAAPSLTTDDTTNVDSHNKKQCVLTVYKAAFEKLQQAIANTANTKSKILSETKKERCKIYFHDLFNASREHSVGVPWQNQTVDDYITNHAWASFTGS